MHQADKGMAGATAEGALGRAHTQHGEPGNRVPCRGVLADSELIRKK